MSAKPLVYVTRRIPKVGLQMVREACDVRMWEGELPPPREVVLQEVADCDGLLCLLTTSVDAEIIAVGKKLRVISQMAVGVDNVDVGAATATGIPVGHTPGVLTDATADMAFALLMAAARRAPEGIEFVRAGKWRTWDPMGLLGADVWGATLGIVGLGRIGTAVARRARGFAMRILYHDVAHKPDLEAELGLEYVELDDLLARADFVSLHCPLIPETRHLIGEQARTLYARVNPHAPEKGASMNVYTHVADNLSPYYSQLIESTSGEAPYILDGLLYHETDLRPREHYSDTRGYTDALFGLCHLLEFRFAPRLRDLSERRLFRMRRNLNEYPNIKSLFVAPINTRIIRDRWDDVLRLAASVESGVMPASRALRKLSAHHPEGKLYKALREVGRIDKTLFLLNFVSDPVFRRRVLVGLNKGESYHALARALVIVLGGVLRSRSIEDQVNQITCLRLLATAIIAWNSVYMGEAVERLRSAGYRVGDDQLSHIYPMFTEHLNMIGEYRFPADGRALTKLDALPLHSLDEALSQLSLGL